MAKFTAIVKEVMFLQVEVEADSVEEVEELIELGEYETVGEHDSGGIEFVRISE